MLGQILVDVNVNGHCGTEDSRWHQGLVVTISDSTETETFNGFREAIDLGVVSLEKTLNTSSFAYSRC